ncbi:hypothetical protein GCM10025865_02050 [Paraoerskovia sediminicola]|uniref:Phosphomannomutase n=1 Tax=Paraoerskovia sediminicola TaxID=1138587 RepID=A0ABN6XBH7_9CELL|nr:hypothetical protein GCM10025865_02050 [Paraoerskovia sediminicola]
MNPETSDEDVPFRPGYWPGSDVDELLERAEAWSAADPDPDDQNALLALVARVRDTEPRRRDIRRAALDELRDRFSGTLAFGTAGLRGRMAAGPNRMNRAVVIRAAAGLGAYLLETVDTTDRPARVTVGFDARHHSRTFALDTAAVLTAAGLEVHVLPRALPTPVLAFSVQHLDADAGVMVTASHNPPADNGYKVYLGGRAVEASGRGAQIVPPHDTGIAGHIDAAPVAAEVPRAGSGWTVLGDDVVRAYLDAVGRWSDGAPRRLRIVTTALHGVGDALTSAALREAGFTDVVPVEEQQHPDPEFSTVSFPNPEEPGAIDLSLALAQDTGADLVIANDPDADRCAVAVLDRGTGTYQGAETARSNGWRMLHGDEVGALLGEEMASRAAPGSVLASSVVSSRLLSRIAAAHGLTHRTTLTGFKWISRVEGLAFGYEEALGYCVDPAVVRDKDGISAGLVVAQVANRLAAAGSSIPDALDDLARTHGLYLTDQVSARFTDLTQIGSTMEGLRGRPRRPSPARRSRPPSTSRTGTTGSRPPTGSCCSPRTTTGSSCAPAGPSPRSSATSRSCCPSHRTRRTTRSVPRGPRPGRGSTGSPSTSAAPWASDVRSGSGQHLRLVLLDTSGPVALLGAPGLVVPPEAPVPRRGERRRAHPGGAQRPAHDPDRPGLAVEEHLGVPSVLAAERVQVEGVDGSHERVPGRLGRALVAADPPQVEVARRRERDLVARRPDLDERDDRRPGCHGLCCGRDRGQRCLVADQQVPVGCGVGRVAAARSSHQHPVAHLGARGPRPRDPLVAVHDEVDRHLRARDVPGADRVGPHRRALRVAVLGEEELHVTIGVRPRVQRLQIRSAEHEPDHRRGQALPGDHDRLLGRSGRPSCLHGEPGGRAGLTTGGRVRGV